MNKKTALQNLVYESGLTLTEFAEKIGVKYDAFKNQYYNQKNRHVQYAFDYGRILEVDIIKGCADNVYFELTFK